MKLDLRPTLDLVHAAPMVTLATLTQASSQLPGFPYATAVPNVPDADHCPLLLVSALAEHTKNLLADPRVSLSLIEPDRHNAQTASRLTLIGRAEPCAADGGRRERYLRYQPEAEQYLELDFIFFRIVPLRIRHIAGLGRMGWIESAEWEAVAALAYVQENELLAAAAPLTQPGTRLLGVDTFGIDYETEGHRRRHGFADSPLPPAELGARMTDLTPSLA